MQRNKSKIAVQQVPTELLVQLMSAGDASASCELIERHQRLAYRTSFSILKNREDAEDAVQEASLRVFQKICDFQGTSAFSTWFTSIVINTCLMQLRKRRTRPTCALEDLAGDDFGQSMVLSHPGASPEQEFCRTELENLMRTTIDGLPPRLREAAGDRFVDEIPIAELAQRRGISRTAAKSRVFRACKMIEQALRPSA